VIPAFPGLWIAPALLAMVLGGVLLAPRLALALTHRSVEAA
jgi:hypothetical protein